MKQFFAVIGILACSNLFGQALNTLYTSSIQITINSSQVSGTSPLADFPVLVDLSSFSTLRNTSQGGDVENINGYDIVFAPASTSMVADLYDHELESYDPTTGEITVWVRIPSVSATVDTNFEMFYGRSGVSSNPSSTDTWNSTYMGVWHLSEDPTGGTMLDATANDNDGAVGGTNNDPVVVPTPVGVGLQLDGDDDQVLIPGDVTLEPSSLTISCWFNREAQTNAFAKMFSKGRAGAPFSSYTLEMRELGLPNLAGFQTGREENNGDASRLTDFVLNLSDTTEINEGEWHFFVGTFDGTTFEQSMYMDGEQKTVISSLDDLSDPGGTYASPIDYYTGDPEYPYGLSIGALSDTTGDFTGIIDELRIMNIAVDTNWVATEVNNIGCGSDFISITGATVKCTAPEVLPVELASFEGRAIGETVQLKWLTASEVDNDYFVVERSLDGEQYEAIGEVKGAGTTSIAQEYSFTDYGPFPQGYYRLKQVDFNGDFEYHHIIMIEIPVSASDYFVYPNPSEDIINVRKRNIGTRVPEIFVEVYSLSGAIVLDKLPVANGFDVKSLSPGIYTLKIHDANAVVSKRLLIK